MDDDMSDSVSQISRNGSAHLDKHIIVITTGIVYAICHHRIS